MKFLKSVVIVVISLFIGVNNVLAEENPKTIFDENVLIDYDIIGSTVVGGYNVSVNNKIEGSSLILGNYVSLNSNIEYALVTGQDITINGKIKDGLILGNNVVLNESSNIERDIIIYANNVEISGLINRNVTIYGENVKIDSVQIAGDIKIDASKIEVTDNAVIMGNLSYNENANFVKSEIASINSIQKYISDKDKEPNLIDMIGTHIIKIVELLVIFVAILLIFPKLLTNIEKNKDSIVKNMGYGLIVLIAIPILVLILIISKFGFALSIIVLLLYLICIYISTIFSGYLLGSIIVDKYLKKNKTTYLKGFIGIIIICILTKLPYIGLPIYFISLLVTGGIIFNILFKNKK